MDIEDIKKELEQDPENADLNARLGWEYEKIKDYDSAVRHLNKAIENGFDAGHALIDIARIYENTGRYSEALGELGRASGLKADSLEIQMSLGRLCRETGDYAASGKYFKKAYEAVPAEDLFLKNKVLNEMEISQKKTVLASKVRGFGVNLSNKCDLRCKMCQIWKTPWDMPRKTIDEIIKLFPYIEVVFWQGGEVFLLDYFRDLFRKAASFPNLYQVIVTHGLLIDENWARDLTRANATLLYSVDSTEKQTYESIRKGADFDTLLRSIDLVNRHREVPRDKDCHGKFETAMNVVVMRSNYRELERFMDFAEERGFDHLHFLPIENVEGPENIFLNPEPGAAERIETAVSAITARSSGGRVRFYNWLPRINGQKSCCTGPEREKEQSSGESGKRNTACAEQALLCYWPWKHMFIEAEGWVRPYAICTGEYVGNVLDNSLQEIWNSEKMQEYRRSIIENRPQDICDPRCFSGVMSKECLGRSIG
ncbi:MAG: radical SAM protein [Elusimicrobia bacterium]|nr:radical SAM protein [Elusimicrobiota bacterium]